MKRIFIAKYRNGLQGLTKIVAESESDAKKAAYAAYTFNTNNAYPAPKIDDVVESVEFTDDQTFGGSGVQPSVTVEGYTGAKAKDVISEQFTAY